MKKHDLNKPKGPNPFPKLAASPKEKHPEPMTLIHKREKDLPDLPYRKPEVTAGLAQRAAGTMADWDNSDPFAYGRTHLHVMQGYLSPKDLIEEMGKRTYARRLAKIKEVEDAKGN
jgi:hypothetical protein